VRDPDGNLVELFVFDGQSDEKDISAVVAMVEGHDGQGGGNALDGEQTYKNWLAHKKEIVDA